MRATCRVCHREIAITKYGVIRMHGAKAPGVWPPRSCEGSRLLPWPSPPIPEDRPVSLDNPPTDFDG